MGGVDKLEASLLGRPVLDHALAAIAGAPGLDRIVLVAAPDRVEALRGRPGLPAAVVAVVAGGRRRQESVALGLAELDRLDSLDGAAPPDDKVVLVHDGARPLVSPDLVVRVVEAIQRHGAAVPILPLVETVKRIEGDRVRETVDRTGLGAAQTPQGATRAAFRLSHARRDPLGAEEWTDEAALLESCSIAVHVVPGEPSNLKITRAEDLARAEDLLRAAAAPGAMTGMRVGFGHDSHPFGPGTPLALGGVDIPGAPRLTGHSDGDVVLHAVADALLGAAGLGDLGRLFPADPSTPRGIASTLLLSTVVERVQAAGYRPSSVDLTVIGARPRLARWLDPMAAAIAAALGLATERVSVKASTGNLAGDEGAGRAMSARAVVVIEPADR
jgi:2-C-methyl-D-erythritol 4-phosphate cytidylyltransferase/2-C-methyl-D-erythritol 2,4-cyclodiphosphate synthase